MERAEEDLRFHEGTEGFDICPFSNDANAKWTSGTKVRTTKNQPEEYKDFKLFSFSLLRWGIMTEKKNISKVKEFVYMVVDRFGEE